MYLVKKTTRNNIALAGEGIVRREPSVEEHAGANPGL
jgi:hypothetical protein